MTDIQHLIDDAVEKAVRACTEQFAVTLKETIEKSSETAAKTAIRTIEKEKKKLKQQDYDWKYHNTKLLIRNYRQLNEYFRSAVFDIAGAEEADESFEDILRMMENKRLIDENVFVESIQRNYLRTKIIMTHVNTMLDAYQLLCERSKRQDSQRHWRVLYNLYISSESMTASDIAKAENIDKRTVYKDIDACISDLTCLFFGVSGIVDF